MTVVILEDAAADIELSRRFYESCEAGVGDYFVDSIFGDLERLVSLAGIHAAHFGFRRMLCKRFPFAIYYEVEGETAYVLRYPRFKAESHLASRPVSGEKVGLKVLPRAM